MRHAGQKRASAPSRRRYLVHLSCAPSGEGAHCRYIARLQPWAARGGSRTSSVERVFADDCELIRAINPLLPQGSDVRDVFEHVESPNGFFYLLRLSSEEAEQFGWRPESTAGNAESVSKHESSD